jgi:hypothetical protein
MYKLAMVRSNFDAQFAWNRNTQRLGRTIFFRQSEEAYSSSPTPYETIFTKDI